ncbi:MAG: methylated-DNA--[protein]-cysteine S-methyltransferase [Bacteroidales bacterium]
MASNNSNSTFNLMNQESNNNFFYKYYFSKIGILKITANENYLLKIEFITYPYSTNEQLLIDIKSKNNIKDINSYTDYLNSKVNFNNICLLTVKQLDEYFDKKRTIFDIPIYQKGTDFQNKVWNEVAKIPYGQTCSYKDIAIKIGKPTAYRAVGNANNKNNIPIIIPCHRVIGSNKKLVGYAGGLNIKKSLLGLEKNNKQQNY